MLVGLDVIPTITLSMLHVQYVVLILLRHEKPFAWAIEAYGFLAQRLRWAEEVCVRVAG
jgi:hypothetical protein